MRAHFPEQRLVIEPSIRTDLSTDLALLENSVEPCFSGTLRQIWSFYMFPYYMK